MSPANYLSIDQRSVVQCLRLLLIVILLLGWQAVAWGQGTTGLSGDSKPASATTEDDQANTSQIILLADVEEYRIVGTVSGATKYSFDVQTDQETIRCFIDESSEFALRLSNPWFDFQAGQVIVDGQMKKDGTASRVAFELPVELHLLTQFRTPQQMDRALASSPVRVNYYLLSPELIEPNLPDKENLIMSGKVIADGQQVSLVIGEETKEIKLGFKGATLRGRSISDLTVGKTKVVVTGQVRLDGNIQATTVIFRPF